jgi:hypothetical protein
MTLELSKTRLANIVGALILLIIGLAWAIYAFDKDGSYIIQNGRVVGVWIVDPMMKVVPLVLIFGALAIIVLALVWPKSKIDEYQTWIAPGAGRRFAAYLCFISAILLIAFLIVG